MSEDETNWIVNKGEDLVHGESDTTSLVESKTKGSNNI